MNADTHRSKALFLLLFTAVLWSTGGLFFKLVTWHPVAIAGMRSAIAAMVLLAVIRRPRFTWSLTQVGCAIAYTLTVTMFVSANKLTTSANAVLLQYSAPIYVALLGAWFLGEKPDWRDWVTIFTVLGGMVLFFLDHLTLGGYWGNLLAILSGVTYAFLIVLMRRQKDGSPLESVLLGNVLTALVSIPFMFGHGPNFTGWLGLLYLGVFQLGLSYILYSSAIKHVTALEGILIPIIEPLLNPVWVFLFVGERPGPWALAGGVVVLIAVSVRYVVGTLGNTRPSGRTLPDVDQPAPNA